MIENELTDKQKRFCEEYVIDWNATRAAIAAGYSKKTAKQIATENLSKPYLKEYIEEIKTDLQKQANISALSQILFLKKMMSSEETTNTEKLRAMQEINKMLGFYAAEKSEVREYRDIPIFCAPEDLEKYGAKVVGHENGHAIVRQYK